MSVRRITPRPEDGREAAVLDGGYCVRTCRWTDGAHAQGLAGADPARRGGVRAKAARGAPEPVPEAEGGADARRVRPAVHRRLREGEPPEGKRHSRPNRASSGAHLLPLFGATRLDQITDLRMAQLKGAAARRAARPSTTC